MTALLLALALARASDNAHSLIAKRSEKYGLAVTVSTALAGERINQAAVLKQVEAALLACGFKLDPGSPDMIFASVMSEEPAGEAFVANIDFTVRSVALLDGVKVNGVMWERGRFFSTSRQNAASRVREEIAVILDALCVDVRSAAGRAPR